MHKQSLKNSKWMEENNADNAHEMRFVPFNSLPTMNSKVRRAPALVDMAKSET
jgi:hypothetical protein